MNPLVLTVQLTPFFHSYTPRMFCETALFNWACVLGTPLSWGMGKKIRAKIVCGFAGGRGSDHHLRKVGIFQGLNSLQYLETCPCNAKFSNISC